MKGGVGGCTAGNASENHTLNRTMDYLEAAPHLYSNFESLLR